MNKVLSNNIISIIFIKILILVLFSSAYMNTLFLPFVDFFAQNGNNPWQYYYLHNLNLDSFPYHGLMLYILSPFMLLINLFEIANSSHKCNTYAF